MRFGDLGWSQVEDIGDPAVTIGAKRAQLAGLRVGQHYKTRMGIGDWRSKPIKPIVDCGER